MTTRADSIRKILDAAPLTPRKITEIWYVIPTSFEQLLEENATQLTIQNRPLLLDVNSAEESEEGSEEHPDVLIEDTPLRITIDSPLDPNCLSDRDFRVYPASVWEEIVGVYQVPYDVAIPRAVIAGEDDKFRVEVNPWHLSLFVPHDESQSAGPPIEVRAVVKWEDIGDAITQNIRESCARACDFAREETLDISMTFNRVVANQVWLSRATPLKDVLEMARSTYCPSSKCPYSEYLILSKPDDVWVSSSLSGLQDDNLFYSSSHQTLQDVVAENQPVLFILIPDSTILTCSVAKHERLLPLTVSSEPLENYLFTGGLVGLANLGNTCFMNSALQCLSHTLPLTTYYLSGKFAKDLNPTNPLGLGGELARTFYAWLREVWQRPAGKRVVVPRDLKHLIGKFAPNFQGYAQQDSQELLSFLLDGLHEDCNRIVDKPYVEAVEGNDDQTDEELGAISWKAHRQRNDSIIVDLFQGQYRSRVECPECGRVSKVFDPFMYCSLPIPQIRRCALTITLFVLDGLPGLQWPYSLPIEIIYRGELVSKQTRNSDKITVDFLKTIIEREATQVQQSILEILKQFHADTVTSIRQENQYHFEDGRLKRLFDFLQKSRAFQRYLQADSQPPSSQNLMRALSSDNRAKYQRGRTDSSPPTIPDAVSQSGSANLMKLAVSSAIVPHQVLDDDPMGEDIFGDPYFANLTAVITSDDVVQKGEDEALLVTFTIPLPEGQKLKRSSDEEDCLTFTFTMGMDFREHSLLKFIARVLRGLKEGIEGAIRKNGSPNQEGLALLSNLDFNLYPMKAEFVTSYQEVYSWSAETQVLASSLDQYPAETEMERLCRAWGWTKREAIDLHRLHIHANCSASFSSNLIGSFADTGSLEVTPSPMPDSPFSPLTILRNAVDLSKASSRIFPEMFAELTRRTTYEGDLLIPQLLSPFAAPKYSYKTGDVPLVGNGTIGHLEEPSIHLTDCFREFGAVEKLEADNRWYCSRCKDFRCALKKIDFWTLPSILVVHLKRFHQEGRFSRSKMQTCVEFPWRGDDTLDLSEFLLPGSPDASTASKYKLFAVSNHSGGLGGGHYVAHAKCFIRSADKKSLLPRWFQFADSSVEAVGGDNIRPDLIVNSSAYILFYEKMGDHFTSVE